MTADVQDQKITIDGQTESEERTNKHFLFKCLSVTTVNIIARFLAEVIGTALLMLFGCASGLSWQNPPPDFVGALTFGLVVMMIIQCFGHVSGAHLNPAVSLCALIYKTLSLPMFVVYVIAQVLGAFIGFGFLVLITPEHIFRPNPDASAGHCSTVPVLGLGEGETFAIEFFATLVLISMCCSSWDPRNAGNQDSVAIKFGLTVGGLSLAFGNATGCSMNPARTLGPAIWNNDWTMHWVYWLAPLSSAAVTTLVYQAIFAAPKPTQKQITDTNTPL